MRGEDVNQFKLSKRLEKVAQYVRKGDRLLDIGSDHAYLPCELIENEVISYAIAGEVVKGPFERSKEEVSRRQLEELVDVRLGSGLDVIRQADQMTTVSICGMGGKLIQQILEDGQAKGKLEGIELLLLQPNVDEPAVRQWLDENGYRISNEDIVEENKKLYEVIVAEKADDKTSTEYSAIDYQFGVHLRVDCPSLYIEKWTKEVKKRTEIIEKLKASPKNNEAKENELKEEITMIRERLALCQN